MDAPQEWPTREYERRLDHLREVFELKLAAEDRALVLQAGEYQRRLDELNHAAQRLTVMQEKFVSSDVYRVEHRALMDHMDRAYAVLTKELKALEKLVWGIAGTMGMLQLLAHFFFK